MKFSQMLLKNEQGESFLEIESTGKDAVNLTERPQRI
jgi:hypothetical protein